MSIYRRRLMIANALKKSDSNINYPGLIAAWSAAGKSNDDADRNVLCDLTGNGHDITLNNFAFSKMSGYGGYRTKLNGKNYLDHDTYNFEVTETSIKIENFTGTLNLERSSYQWTWNEYNIKVIGLNADEYLRIYYCLGSSSLGWNYIEIRNDGIYTVPQSTMSDSSYNRAPFIKGNFKNIAIQLLPEYPDALVFDGVDDYGINEEMPILTDYTFISCLKWITEPNAPVYPFAKGGGLDNNTIFSGHSSNGRAISYVYSFGYITNVKGYTQELINYQTPTFYNNKNITKGSVTDLNYPFLLGKFSNKHTPANMAFYSAYLFDRSLDEQEIKAFIRKYIDADYLLPSEIPTPDCYYDFTNGDNASETRDTIVDLSGNGNDAKAYNFAWNEAGSGYKDGALQFDGTDDYISLEAFDSGFQTILMLCNYSTLKILYDQRNDEHQFSDDERFVIFAQGNSVAYNWGNVGGVTYINGKLNSSVLTNETILKKHCICINNPTVTSEFTTIPKIGGPSTTTSKAYAKMSVFKFLGFKEALTEEQIQYVIKKYNLLDGVDEIEVS